MATMDAEAISSHETEEEARYAAHLAVSEQHALGYAVFITNMRGKWEVARYPAGKIEVQA